MHPEVAPDSASAPIAVLELSPSAPSGVAKALQFLGIDALVTADPVDLLRAPLVIVAGHGAFAEAMKGLHERKLHDLLKEIIQAGTPYLGLGLGLQLLFDRSDEAPGQPGLGILSGYCAGLTTPRKQLHAGWNRLDMQRPGSPLDHVPSQWFYFQHSFHVIPEDPTLAVATAPLAGPLVAAIRHRNIFAVQFQPYKSGHAGLELLRAAVTAPWRSLPSTQKVPMVRDLGSATRTVQVRLIRPESGGVDTAIPPESIDP